MIVLVMSVALLLSITSHTNYKRWLNPITVYVIPHSASMILLLGSNYINKQLSEKTFLLFFASEFVYSIGVVISEKYTIKKHRWRFKKLKINLFSILIPVSIIVDICIIFYIRAIQNSFGIQNALANLSSYNSFLQNEGVTGFYNIVVFFSIPLSLLIQVCIRKLPEVRERPFIRLLLIVQYIICFVPYVSARRGVLLLSIVMNLMLFYLLTDKKRKHNYKRILLFCFLIYVALLFFSRTQAMMNKDVDFSVTCFGVAIPPLFRDAFGYFAGNYSYLDQLLINDISIGAAPLLSTLRIAYIYIAPVLGVSVDTTSAFSMDFLQIGSQTSYSFNTVPIHYYFMVDVGVFFLVEFLVLGIITGSVYKKMRNGNKHWNHMFCAFQFALVFMSFREYDMIFIYSIITLLFIWFFKQFDYTIKDEEVDQL